MTEDRSPRLIWTEDGAPRSGRFDDVYFSREDGLAESRAVFLAGCGLPEAWRGRRRFTVAELGFGTGLNIAALLDLWRREGPADGWLNIVSVEGFPLRRDDAARALETWPEIADAAQVLLDGWPAPTPGFHRVDLPGFSATLDLAVGEAAWALSGWSGRADAWFLDGFAPSTNPGMWSDAVLDAVAARSAPGARVATFTVAGAVRRGLSERGFSVDKRPGHGRKRERLEARLPGSREPGTTPSVAIIGAGIAGAALTRVFAALGLTCTVVEETAAGSGASGFPSALVTPRLDAGDAGIAALHAQALARAGALYAAVPGAILTEGVLQLEQAARDAARFAKVATQDIWPEGAVTPLPAAACAERLNEPVETGGLLMRDALVLDPRPVLEAWLAMADRVSASVARVEPVADGWRLINRAGDPILEAGIVVIAAGWGAAALAPDLPLAPVRGQADWVEGVTSRPAAWGGYAAPTGTGLLFGATHDRGDTRVEADAESTARNLQTLGARLPRLAARVAVAEQAHSRAAVRATTPDRLPLAGALAPGLFVLTGLGSRGFCVAPLLAEHVAALALDAPSPLPTALSRRLEPNRFVMTLPLAQPSPRVDD
ncbi:tRNA (5-methylaminomethyl-2-thiouridine)(34)-methyltransferase MnmD [Brevundimonas sp.]|uniref:tRNA (5-methylaminomethyl-2-thiouridine)(34)-methyltransferase MnmD n=1 Tax=Brevundimonas sp. TaxID=1871086 RepID=UPI002D366FAB|nr:tRNA (5-methylaminomethyl-2-thiouridine)(34)-methyltransferase MnmD [Brevundimonas sp.]HYC97618.1 tRNA (5-methylaminomethyl-2-thiouridine)(34)-methyltransferase MnmD [Brevundimonas sp.]